MSHVLRQSTQVIVRIGPFMDVTDAATPETGITLAAADQAEALKAAGAATADISGDTWAAIANCGGWYDLTLTTTDTNTLGDLTIVIQDTSVCLPVFARFQVIEEAAYDAIYAASASPATTAGAVGSVTGAVGSVTGAVGSVTGAVGSVTGAVGSVTGAVGSVTGITAANIGDIKTKTDQLTFTVVNQVDTNIQSVNDVTVNGVGTAGSPWGP